MKIEKVLEKLEELLKGWGLTRNNWVFTGEYAWKLQGYNLKPREGHLDIFVDRKKLPWKVDRNDASAIPPRDSFKFKQLKEFIEKTKSDPHFLPLPIGELKWQTIGREVKHSQIYTLPNGRKIRINNLLEAVEDRLKVLLKQGIQIWDEAKIKRWLDWFYQVRKLALKKNDERMIKACDLALKRCRKIRGKPELKTRKKKISLKISQIKGDIAYRGKVRGRVKIILDFGEFSKFQNGNILVTPMTTPNFILAIEKAKAIVTDRGGIGCHAAVISREFKIPCIIGTKIATQVLRDGDLVEVDANKGMVKILKRAKKRAKKRRN